MTPPAVSARPSAARERLLATASGLFYGKGVHAVGTEEIVSTAQVTRATFYRHFPSKDDLVVEYLRTADHRIRAAVAAAVAVDPASPGSAVRAIAGVVIGQIGTPGFRGCAFLNAAAEYPDPDDPIHAAILAHRAWFRAAVHDAFAQVTDRASEATAHFVMLRDGAMAEGCLGEAEQVTATFHAGVEGMLATFPRDHTPESGAAPGVDADR